MNKSVYHLPPEVTETCPYVLLPGDPERVDLILSHLDKPELLGQRREFRVGRGRIHGLPIMVASTGIGGPSTAILAHELHVLGAKTLIRVGTSGSLSPHVRVGDMVLASGAIRDEGTSQQYLPLEFPALASPDVLEAIRLGLSAISSHPTVHVGVVHSKDAFYAQKRPGDLPLEKYHRSRYNTWTRGGALVSEMECATLFIVGQSLGFRTSGILQVMSSPFETTASRPDFDIYLNCIVQAMSYVIQRDVGTDSASE